MVQCCVPKCKNRSDNQNWKKTSNVDKNRKITFHSIPKNNTNRNLWTDIINLPPHIPKNARICSDHFSKESFDQTNGLLTRLRPNVLPLNECEKHIETEKRENDSFIVCPQPSTTDKETMTSIQPCTAGKATMVSFKRIYNSPEKCRLRNLLI
ncbi:uncharacterized protein LOC112588889 [Harpegnathos saltator]|uniref:uncharacterized protein LOC112588889 n=1 Tax=Harpegnathos saltator TaxID=610380 RepID=UPI000DBED356|nr:uncharacterized protein LOC112588889 [Harpegnathos saltator]